MAMIEAKNVENMKEEEEEKGRVDSTELEQKLLQLTTQLQQAIKINQNLSEAVQMQHDQRLQTKMRCFRQK